LRHTFGLLAINRLSIVAVREAMGHADIETTTRYLHHKVVTDEARVLASAFTVEPIEEGSDVTTDRRSQGYVGWPPSFMRLTFQFVRRKRGEEAQATVENRQ
jgi:hypothetical protein